MKIGLMINPGPDSTVDKIIEQALIAEEKKFDSLWMANIFGLDAITTLALIGHATSTIKLGTAVVPTYPRHPTAIAQQALTAGAASSGRFTLGIGLSHQVVIEGMLGLSYDKPARHMKEYLSILAPLLNGETVNYSGQQYTANNVSLSMAGQQPVPLLVAALGPRMLKLAGELTHGTVTWMTGPNTLKDYIIPTINQSANAAGKPDATVAAGFPIALTDNPDEARAFIAKELQIYGMLPSYRAMLDKEGIDGPADLAIVGDEATLRGKLQQLRDAGVTDFCASIVAANEETEHRTLSFLASEL